MALITYRICSTEYGLQMTHFRLGSFFSTMGFRLGELLDLKAIPLKMVRPEPVIFSAQEANTTMIMMGRFALTD